MLKNSWPEHFTQYTVSFKNYSILLLSYYVSPANDDTSQIYIIRVADIITKQPAHGERYEGVACEVI